MDNVTSLQDEICAAAAEEQAALASARQNVEPAEPAVRRPLLLNPNDYCGTRYTTYPPNYDWLLAQSLRRGCLGALVGAPGVGKGTFAIQMSVSVAAGVPVLDIWPVDAPGRVIYLSAEDDELVLHRRFYHTLQKLPESLHKQAIANFYGISVHGNVRLSDGNQNLTDLSALVANVRPVMVIIDTLARFSGSDDKDNQAMQAFCELLEPITVDYDCNIIVTHHTNKASGDIVDDKKSLGAALNQTAVRGASSFVGCCRWAILMAQMSAKLAKEVIGVEASGTADGSFIAVRVAKKNCGAPERRHYLGRDEQGILVRVEGTEADARKLAAEVQRRAEAGEGPLGFSNGGHVAFGWSKRISERVAEAAVEMGLLTKVSNGRNGFCLSVVPDGGNSIISNSSQNADR
jgi:hypothetical protein